MCLTQSRHVGTQACREMGGTHARHFINANTSCDNILVMCVKVCNKGSPSFLRLTRLTSDKSMCSPLTQNYYPAHIYE